MIKMKAPGWTPQIGSIDAEAIGGLDQVKRSWLGKLHNKDSGVSEIRMIVSHSCVWGLSTHIFLRLINKSSPDRYQLIHH